MSTDPTDKVGTRSVRVEPDAHGQAALLLAESILHALVEGRMLSTDEAIAVVRTASEVKVEVALAAHESKGRMVESLNLLAAIGKTFEADQAPDT